MCTAGCHEGRRTARIANQADQERQTMTEAEQLVKSLRAALERRPEINLHAHDLHFDVEDGVLVMRGNVETIAAKRVARLEAARLLGADHVSDHLRLIPVEPRSDGAIADELFQALHEERALRDYRKAVHSGAEVQGADTATAASSGAIDATVRDAVVTLEGVVESLTHKRLVDILAWWTRGTCDVKNHLHVQPEERDTDGEVTDALRMVLEKDPWLDAGQIRVRVQDHKVTLEGLVFGEEQRNMATQDAWSVLGVHGVDNRLQVQTQGGG
jgi:osmotically-inducible protein OsmY